MKLLRDGLLLSLAVTIMLGVMTLASRQSKVFPQPMPGPIRHWLCGPQAGAPPKFALCEGFPWWVRVGRLVNVCLPTPIAFLVSWWGERAVVGRTLDAFLGVGTYLLLLLVISGVLTWRERSDSTLWASRL
jgi:hypothetical protein